MVRKKINTAIWYLEDHLRRICSGLSPDARLVVALIMLVLFSALSFYITFTAFYHFGKGAGERMQIRHIERLELELGKKQKELDSVTHQDCYNGNE